MNAKRDAKEAEGTSVQCDKKIKRRREKKKKENER